MSPDKRVAVYYAPATDDPLWRCGADWLGRDPESGASRPQPDLPDIAAVTAEARGYAFHCTLKPPMRLRPGSEWRHLLETAEQVASDIPAFELPALAVVDHHGFLALRETRASPELQALADAFVDALDGFRAPPGDAELARRRRGGLDEAGERNLVRWGYPYVFDRWFFHMTLTRRLTADEKAIYLPAAERFFAAALAGRRRVEDVCLFTQAQTGAPFQLALRVPLRG